MSTDTNTRTITRLRAARLRAGLPAQTVASRAGIGMSTLLLAEKAPQLATERTLAAVAAVLGCEITELVDAGSAPRSRLGGA